MTSGVKASPWAGFFHVIAEIMVGVTNILTVKALFI